MSQANVEKFFEIIENDEVSRKALMEGAKSQEQVAERSKEMAGERGLAFSKEHAMSWIEAQSATRADGELNDKQLDGVSGAWGKTTKDGFDPYADEN